MGRIGYRQPACVKYEDSEFKLQISRLYKAGDIKGASALYAMWRTPMSDEQFDNERNYFESKDGGMNLL